MILYDCMSKTFLASASASRFGAVRVSEYSLFAVGSQLELRMHK